MKKKKILVGLSGGVDSAITAYLLKEAGHDVTAGFMINYLAPEGEHCPTKEDIEVAKEVAGFLDIPFFTFDYRDEYEEKVLNYMYEGYKKGITPNPDIMCNSEIKFKVFLDEALELGFDMVATGHYARIEEEWGVFKLKKWVDNMKDQSYFLAGLDQIQLSKALFPIGNMQKSEVRELARKIGLPNAERKDSQGICFVGKVRIADFLQKKIPPKEGNIVDTSGKILGTHKGIYYYTVGQRKGLDVWGMPEPIFVLRKDLETNELVVGYQKDAGLYGEDLIVAQMHFLGDSDIEFPLTAKAKIRYRQADQDVVITKVPEGYKITFSETQRAIASGQIAAIYVWDDLVMSWVIS